MRTDEELMAAYQRGERAAFDEIFTRYAGLVAGLARRYTGSDADARDLVQQTFLNLHRARNDYRPGARLRSWLVTIALNVAREHGRRRGRRREQELADADHPVAESSAHTGVEAAETGARVHRALARLPEGQRRVIEMHWLDGLSFAEIGVALGLKRSAVKVRAHRGYVRLRELLPPE